MTLKPKELPVDVTKLAATCIALSKDNNSGSVTQTTSDDVSRHTDNMPVVYGYVGKHKVSV